MNRSHWRGLAAVVSVGIATASAEPATYGHAPGPELDYAGVRQGCADERVPDRQLAACTAVIARAGISDELLAIASSNRGVAYRARGELLKAITDFSRALELEPTYYPALFNRARTRSAMRDHDGALADYGRLVDELDYAGWVWRHGGRDHVLEGSADLTRGREVRTDHTNFAYHEHWDLAHLSRAGVYFRIGDLGRAARDITRSVWGKNTNALFYRSRARMFLQQGMLQFAYASFEAALRADPRDDLARRGRDETLAGLETRSPANDDGMPAWPLHVGRAPRGEGRVVAVALGALTAGSHLQSAAAVLELTADRGSAVVRAATFYFGEPRRYEGGRDGAGGELTVTAQRTVIQLEEEESCGTPACPLMSSFMLPIDIALLRARAGGNQRITVKDDGDRLFTIVIPAEAAMRLLAAADRPPE